MQEACKKHVGGMWEHTGGIPQRVVPASITLGQP